MFMWEFFFLKIEINKMVQCIFLTVSKESNCNARVLGNHILVTSDFCSSEN